MWLRLLFNYALTSSEHVGVRENERERESGGEKWECGVVAVLGLFAGQLNATNRLPLTANDTFMPL